MSGAETDEGGRVFAPGHIVAPGCGPTLVEERFYSCPVAAMHQPWVGRVLRRYELGRAGLATDARLTSGASDALLVTAHEFEELRHQIEKRERQLASARRGQA